MSIQCKSCGHELPDRTKFCGKCGAKVATIWCPQCGKALPEDSKFCTYCGTTIGQTDCVPMSVSADTGTPPVLNEAAPEELSTSPIQENIAKAEKPPIAGESSAPIPQTEAEQDASSNMGTSSTIFPERSTISPQDSTQRLEKFLNQRKPNKLFMGLAIIILGFLIFQFFNHRGYDIEYSHNDGGKLPIIVTDINISGGGLFQPYGTIATFNVTNTKDTDYRYAQFAVLAWDNDGFPIKLDQFWDHEYVDFFDSENIQAKASQQYERVLGFDISDIAYMSVFLVYYEDFASKAWENPITNHWEKIEGQKLEDIDIYFYEFG